MRLPDFAVSLWAEKSTPVTSWNVSPDQDQVTLPPAATVTRIGENWLNAAGMPTFALDGALLAWVGVGGTAVGGMAVGGMAVAGRDVGGTAVAAACVATAEACVVAVAEAPVAGDVLAGLGDALAAVLEGLVDALGLADATEAGVIAGGVVVAFGLLSDPQATRARAANPRASDPKTFTVLLQRAVLRDANRVFSHVAGGQRCVHGTKV